MQEDFPPRAPTDVQSRQQENRLVPSILCVYPFMEERCALSPHPLYIHQSRIMRSCQIQESHGFSPGGCGGVCKEGLLKHSSCNSVIISTCPVERGVFRQAHPSSRCPYVSRCHSHTGEESQGQDCSTFGTALACVSCVAIKYYQCNWVHVRGYLIF